jgi:methanogenic corrinoid protein MtbC1
MTIQERRRLSEKLRASRDELATRVNKEFFNRHPDWRERYGDRGVERGREDAGFHIDFLRGAIEADSAAPFEDYASWVARLLSARGIAPGFLAENLQQIADNAADLLDGTEQAQVRSVIQAGIGALAGAGAASQAAAPEIRAEFEPVRRLFTQAILLGHRKPALAMVMEAVEQGTGLTDVYVDILQAALFDVGRRWEGNQITVAEEHMATAIVQYVVAQLYQRIERPANVKGRVVVTGVQGELHHIGANIVADVLEASGWDVRFLGTNMPREGILRVIEQQRATVVGISVTMLFNIPQLISLIDAVNRAFGQENVRVIVGGAAFRSAPELWKETGAHGFANDAREVAALVERLTQRPAAAGSAN